MHMCVYVCKSRHTQNADDTMVYRCISKNIDDQSLTSDLPSDLVLTTQWRKRLTCIIQYPQNQVSNISSLTSRP